MKIQKPEPPTEISIFVPDIKPTSTLTDFRLTRRYGGMQFGSIGQCARNLGVSMKVKDGGLVFSAPRVRLQRFVEKLHFAMVRYRQL